MEKMNVTTAHYFVDRLTGENASIRVIIDGQVMIVPLDPANRHYAEIMRQVDAGTLTIAPADT